MANTKLLFLLLFTCLITNSRSLRRKGTKTYSHTDEKVKKQQVLVPMRNFATTVYDQNNLMSPMLHLDGTNEVSPLRAPSTVFVNGDNQVGQSYSPMEGQQSEDNDEPYQEAPAEDNNYNTAYSSLFGNEMENYNDDNNDNTNMAFADDSRQAPYDDQSNEGYLSQTNEEEENAPVRTMTNYNKHDSNYISDATVQGGLVPTLSSLIASRIKAINRLTSLGQQHSTLTSPNYASLVKQLLKAQAQEVKASSRLHLDHSLSKAPKIDNGSQNHNQTQQINAVDETNAKNAKVEDADHENQELEYKKNVKNAELAANLAEAAKTLTKLVNKLTVQDAIIRKKGDEGVSAKKNNSGDTSVDGGWSEWSKWSACTTTCGGGFTYSKRSCTGPPPLHEGKNCGGRGLKVRLCHLNRCKTTDAKKVSLERSLSEMAARRSHIYRPSDHTSAPFSRTLESDAAELEDKTKLEQLERIVLSSSSAAFQCA